MSPLFRGRHAEVLAGGGRFSGLHSLRELLYSYGFAGEWLDRRASPNPRVVFGGGHTAVRERAADVARAGIASRASLRGFVPHPGGLSSYLDDRSNIRGTLDADQGSLRAPDGFAYGGADVQRDKINK